jgi:hypothetical protein
METSSGDTERAMSEANVERFRESIERFNRGDLAGALR